MRRREVGGRGAKREQREHRLLVAGGNGWADLEHGAPTLTHVQTNKNKNKNKSYT